MPKLPSRVISRIPARKLCRQQQPVSLTGFVNTRRRAIFRRARMVTTIEIAMRNAAVMPERARNKLHLADLSSPNAITRGKGAWHDFRMLIDASNIAQCLACDFGIGGSEVKDAIAKAEMALLQCAARFERTQRFGFTSEELQAVCEVLEWAHAQREVTPRAIYTKAVRLLTARVRSGHNTIDLEAVCAAINGREGVAA